MARARGCRDRMVAFIAAVAGAAALYMSYPVIMPLAAAVFLIAALWPVKTSLDRSAPRLSYAGTDLFLLILLAAFFSTLYFSSARVVQAFSQKWDQLETLYGRALV